MSKQRPNLLMRLLKPTSLPMLLVAFVVVFAIGFAANELRRRTSGPSTEAAAITAMEHDHTAESVPQTWTCSMHPHIKKNKPGKCPLCAMDLIPLSANKGSLSGMRQMVVSPAARALMNIQVAPAEHRYVEAEVRMVGKVDFDETRLKHITAWVPGRLDRLFVDYTGVRVNKGDHMVYIYSEQLYVAQQALIQEVQSRRKRGNKPDKGFFGGIDLLESSREKLRLLGVTKEQIKEIESRDKPADHMMIYAPMGGIVIEKFKQQGDRVNTGERIYTVADLSHLWVRMHAFESDLMWLRYGQTATFTTDAYPGEEFVGRIAFIDPVLDDRTRTVKVRVNIDNTEGKLKPEMFVRGIVKAKVAAGGRVIDADLEGKWISPMHPEIVKDEPGTCDICGMPLVRAESLGYVAARIADLAKPLVIPVSAALITGTRAIVYVEDPKAKEPTFEGREIVLGPRAGDYYLVHSGLNEGELVVTSGNFKIDSALQILAKPSMMTPDGGGGGGQHHHGEGDTQQPNAHAERSPGATGQAAPMVMELPISIHQKLHAIIEAQQKITAAVKNTDLATARKQFVAVGKAAQSIDTSLLDGHPKLILNELEMLIANDAVEGGTLTDIANAERVLASLTRNIERLDRQFGILQAGHLPQRLEVPSEFRLQLAALWTDYAKIGDALANDDFDAAKSASRQLAASLTGVDMKLLSDNDAHMLWIKEARNITTIGKSLVEAKDIKTTREHFEPLSGVMQALALTFGFGPEQPVYLLHCPMAFDNTGASWLQKDDQTRNPYFGATMLQCADRKELISGDHTASNLRAPTTNGQAEGTK